MRKIKPYRFTNCNIVEVFADLVLKLNEVIKRVNQLAKSEGDND